MKLTCDIVQDLLPLYEDGLCSPDSRAAVEEHLKTCSTCRYEQEIMQKLPDKEILLDAHEEKRAASGFRKLRRRWAASLLILLLLIPMFLMAVNQIRGMGICYTNIDEMILSRRFVKFIETGEYQKAAQMYDFTQAYQDIHEVLSASPELYQPNFHACKIGDEIWYVQDHVAEDIDFGYDTDRVWMQLIYTRNNGILITQEQMDALSDLEDGSVTTGQDGYTINDGQTYYPLETPWGRFLAEETDIDAFLQSEMDDIAYANQFTVMPEEMYLDILPALEAQAREQHETNLKLYEAVGNMTEDEFCTHMQEKYAAELEAVLSQGTTLSGGYYYRAYHISSTGYAAPNDPESGWSICFRCDAANGEEHYPINLDVHISGKKVTDLSLSYANDTDWCEDLTDALFPGYLS